MPPPLSSSPIVRSIQLANQARDARANASQQIITPETLHVAETDQTDPNADGLTVTPPPASRAPSGRRAQNVLSKAQKHTIALWMIAQEDEGKTKIPSKAVSNFPQFFRGAPNANIARAVRYWKERRRTVENYKTAGKRNIDLYMCRARPLRLKIRISKTAHGRGRKRSIWVAELYTELCSEFDRMRKCSVKLNANLLLTIARSLVMQSNSDNYGPTHTDPRSGKLILDHLDKKWVERFMHANRIVSRVQTGKLSPCSQKIEMVEREVAYHLGCLKRDLESGRLDENFMFNADETHFVVDLNDGRTLAMKGDTNVKFADVVSGDVGMTMMVMLGGGCHAYLGVAFMIFQNDRSSYPIQGVPDNVPGACYRSGPKGWMDSRVFTEWLSEKRVMSPLPDGRERVLYVDNASGHKLTADAQEALRLSNTVLRFLPKNATDLCQPADSFIIQKIKAVWRRRWDEKRLDMIKKNEWVDWKTGSGKLPNPGKTFYLKLAADVMREVGNARDKEGVSLTRKAMIGCGMALNFNGLWEVRQLFPHLQSIVSKYADNFNGKPVADSLELDGAVTESDGE